MRSIDDMTMSEREFTIRLTGPQFRSLSSAVNERLVELDEMNSKQERATLDRAWNQIQAGWNRSVI